MALSNQTLSDCLLKDRDGNQSPIAKIFNFTRTDGGHKKLLFLLTNKKDSVEEIISTQNMLKHITADPQKWDFGLNNADLYYLNEYFRFEKKLLPKRIPGINLLFKKQPDLEFIRTGVKNVYIFLSIIRTKTMALKNSQNPNLRKKLEFLSEIFKYGQIHDLLKADMHGLSRYEIVKTDYFLRFTFKPVFHQALEVLYEIEALYSMAKAVKKYNLQFPEISASRVFTIEGAWNPLVKNCVKNSFNYEAGKNLVFLTGPNMSGKSTFLRTIGLIVCLAHTGMAVPAEKATIPFFEEITVSITIQDNLAEGYSHFYSELQIVKSIARGLREGKTHFSIFDELFKGTNLADAIACAGALVKGFSHHKDSFFIISSHHAQLIDEPGDVQFNYIEALIDNDQPKFTYSFRPGKSELHLGRYLFKKEGIDDILLP